jgi:hypothetical protein
MRIDSFIEMRSVSKPLQKFWSPLYAMAWFALTSSREAL